MTICQNAAYSGGVSLIAISDNRIGKGKIMLEVRKDVETVTYRRPPTKFEIRFGHGATHYRNFAVEDCCKNGTRVLKKWFKAEDDGLRYYR